jgi:hypothetical protein
VEEQKIENAVVKEELPVTVEADEQAATVVHKESLHFVEPKVDGGSISRDTLHAVIEVNVTAEVGDVRPLPVAVKV